MDSLFSVSQSAASRELGTTDRKGSITEGHGRKMSMFPGADRRKSSIGEKNTTNNMLNDLQPFISKQINQLPDKLLIGIFGYLKQNELCKLARVCKKWRVLAYDSKLWTRVSLRPDYSGLHVTSVDSLLGMISVRFGPTLRYMELSADLITPTVLQEIANRCPNLKHLTLDFSNAMQLHDFNDMNAFPCNLRSMTICLSEVIFMEGFMRKVYQHISVVQVLHLIGTFELGDEAQEEVFEVINIAKIKAHTPNLRIVNLYGINFVDDSHIEMLSGNCIHLECLALNFCLKVKGSTLKTLVMRCKKLRTLLLQHCSLEDENMKQVEWERSVVHELDLSSTELSTDCLMDILCRIPGLTFLGLAYCEFFNDKILEELINKGKLDHIRAIDLSHTVGLSDEAIFEFLRQRGRGVEGLMLCGKPSLTEQFFLNIIPLVKKIRILGIGTGGGGSTRITTRVHIDQIIICLCHQCPKLERLEVQWDPEIIRFSDNSGKFIDQMRQKCPLIKSVTLSDGEYYELVKSNFERAERATVVRTTTNYITSIVSLLSCYRDLLFN